MMRKAILREAVVSLASAKQRSLLALIGIVIGIGSVIAMVSVSSIVQEEALHQFKEMGTDLVSIESDQGNPGQGPKRSAAATTITAADLQGLREASPALADLAPVVSVYSEQATVAGKRLERQAVIGTTASLRAIARLPVVQGRFLSELDGESRHAVIGQGIAQALAKQGVDDPAAAHIRIGDAIYEVVGVLGAAPFNQMAAITPDESIFIPLRPALRLSKKNAIGKTLGRVKPGIDNPTAMAEAKRYFKGLGKTVQLRSPDEIIAQMEKQMQMFSLLAGAIGSISLIVGGIGVMNVMLVSVTERRKEIGVRRALGARRGDVQAQFLVESVILSMIGGVFGVLLGVGAAWLVAYFAHWGFVLSLGAIGLGVGVAGAVGIFFGFYPARQAARLDPIQALRSD